MSKGPGTWQRLILATLENRPGFYVLDLLPAHADRAQCSALWRATRSLEAAGSIDVDRYVARTVGNGSVVVLRPGVRLQREQIPKLNVVKGSN